MAERTLTIGKEAGRATVERLAGGTYHWADTGVRVHVANPTREPAWTLWSPPADVVAAVEAQLEQGGAR